VAESQRTLQKPYGVSGRVLPSGNIRFIVQAMRALRPWHYFAIVLGLAGLAVAFVWHTAPASAMDPPPPFPLYLPIVQVSPPQ
jgi:hypothetical protein